MSDLKIGDAYGVYQYTDSTRQFTSLVSIPDYFNRSEFIECVSNKTGCKAVGAFVIRSIKVSNLLEQAS